MNKSILFNTEMVRAILDGRKTVTSRVVKPQPKDNANLMYCFAAGRNSDIGKWHDHKNAQKWTPPYHGDDILYVRETWNQCYDGSFVYKADSKPNSGWRPSIHMPKEAARLFLRVTDVRVERLQEISNKDALREGVARHGLYNEECYAGGCYNGDFESSCAECEVPRKGFSKLWDSTVKDTDRYGWNANPWVFVIEFERCEKPEGFDV